MPSLKTKQQLVELAVAKAGRGPELYAHAKSVLDIMLRSWGLKAKYPALRKFGAAQALAAGSWTAPLPSDYGAGSEHILFGGNGKPINELDADEFFQRYGNPASDGSTGRPGAYMVDKEAQLFRFNSIADQEYPFTPVYFKVPPTVIADSDHVWLEDDDAVIQGIIEEIYQFKADDREFSQGQKVDAKLQAYRRGTVPLSGGTSRMKLSPTRFK